MNLDTIRAFCLSLPHATEQIQWENDLLFKVGGKMFAVVPLEPGNMLARLTFKTSKDKCAELLEIEGIERAAYIGRYDWVTLQRWDVLRDEEIRELVRESYGLVRDKLPKSARDELGEARPGQTRRAARKR
jgi:predicted DNA-binding protein (MmcQ/YjbR family)